MFNLRVARAVGWLWRAKELCRSSFDGQCHQLNPRHPLFLGVISDLVPHLLYV